MEIKNGVPTTLRQIGKDERWLQDWLAADPRRLGIGNVTIKSKELQHFAGRGGRLDLLAYDPALDTYYEIEIMLASTIHFSAKSYISLKKGRRTWLPMWPRQDGFYAYIPSGPGGSEDQPNDFFARVKDSLAELNIEPSWSFKYNAGANPIAFTVARQNINHSIILDILKEAYEFA